MEHGKCTSVLKGHSDSVTAVSFSPSGRLLATGAADQCVHVWSAADGSLVRTYRGNGQVFAVSWNSSGDKLAASFESGLLSVLDIRT
jgi:transducin (beta)-like 1